MTMAVFFNNHDGAIDALRHALAKGGRNVVTLAANDPNLDRLRDDPEFKQILGEACERFGIVPRRAASPAEASALLRS
jgi:DNA-binding LacI/PurR family transcriptional regulator